MWEVADHQTLKDMSRKVKEYIVDTAGSVRIVIIIKMERQKPPRKRKREAKDDLSRDNIEYNADSLRNPEAVLQEDGSNDRDQAADPEAESRLLAPGKLIRGVFWVFNYRRAPTPTMPNASEIVCLEEEQVSTPPPQLSRLGDECR